jgi:hypothetical protein
MLDYRAVAFSAKESGRKLKEDNVSATVLHMAYVIEEIHGRMERSAQTVGL